MRKVEYVPSEDMEPLDWSGPEAALAESSARADRMLARFRQADVDRLTGCASRVRRIPPFPIADPAGSRGGCI